MRFATCTVCEPAMRFATCTVCELWGPLHVLCVSQLWGPGGTPAGDLLTLIIRCRHERLACIVLTSTAGVCSLYMYECLWQHKRR